MAYNEKKAQARFEEVQQRLREQKAFIQQFELITKTLEHWEPPPRSLLDQWRAGEVGLGPHEPMRGGKPNLQRLTCIGCGCCRMMPKHLYCEQCLIGRRPWARR